MADRRTLARLSASALALGAALAFAAPAEASDTDTKIFTLMTAVPGAVDTLFLTYDVATAAHGLPPKRGWSIAEIAATAPPALFYDVILIAFDYYLAEDDGKDALLMPFLILGGAGTSMLTTHGIWSLASSRFKPGVVIGGSLAFGADVTLSSIALAATFQRRLPDRAAGITQLVLSVPQVIAGSYQLATSPADRGLWITMTAWSGALFIHGLASAIKGKLHRPGEDIPPPPPPPPLPEKPPLMVPASIDLSPMMVTDGVARAPGLGIYGVF